MQNDIRRLSVAVNSTALPSNHDEHIYVQSC